MYIARPRRRYKANGADAPNPAFLEIDMNRDIVLNFRVTEKERQIIEDKAYTKYDSLAPYLRDAALGKDIIVIPGLTGIDEELNAIGNNLNQLTRLANSGKIDCVDLSETRNEVAKIWRLLNSLLEKYQ